MEGNQQKMRETLESVRNWCYNKLHNTSHQVTVEGLLSIVNSALAEPSRNCDIYDEYCIVEEFEKAMGKTPSRTADEQDKYMKENWFIFKHWLFAPAEKGVDA